MKNTESEMDMKDVILISGEGNTLEEAAVSDGESHGSQMGLCVIFREEWSSFTGMENKHEGIGSNYLETLCWGQRVEGLLGQSEKFFT